MKLKIYSVFDSKMGVFTVPFFHMNHATALRTFSDMAQDRSIPVGKHPTDFSLFCIGDFDDIIGEVDKCVPENLGLASAVVHAAAQPDFRLDPRVADREPRPLVGEGFVEVNGNVKGEVR